MKKPVFVTPIFEVETGHHVHHVLSLPGDDLDDLIPRWAHHSCDHHWGPPLSAGEAEVLPLASGWDTIRDEVICPECGEVLNTPPDHEEDEAEASSNSDRPEEMIPMTERLHYWSDDFTLDMLPDHSCDVTFHNHGNDDYAYPYEASPENKLPPGQKLAWGSALWVIRDGKPSVRVNLAELPHDYGFFNSIRLQMAEGDRDELEDDDAIAKEAVDALWEMGVRANSFDLCGAPCWRAEHPEDPFARRILHIDQLIADGIRTREGLAACHDRSIAEYRKAGGK